MIYSYFWIYNDAPFDPSGNDGRIAIQPGSGTLIFARPLARDEAYYQCFANNTAGTAATVKINLRQASKFSNLCIIYYPLRNYVFNIINFTVLFQRADMLWFYCK